MRLTKEQILEARKDCKTFKELHCRLGVTDMTLRKWSKRYGIPNPIGEPYVPEPPTVDKEDNRPLEDWGKLLSDVPTAGAILDRLLHHAITIAITGRSYRIKDSLPAAPEAKKAKKPNEPSTAGAAS